MTKLEQAKESANITELELKTEVDTGNQKFIIKRHFTGERSLREAIYKVIQNEAVRKIA